MQRGPEPLAEDNNDFALALYGELREKPGNILFSPFSIRTALGMALVGARGEAAAQMSAALRISSSDEAFHASLGAMIQRLNAADGGPYEMAVANSLWGQVGSPVQSAFLDRIAGHYGSSLNSVDFRQEADSVRTVINQWVEARTKQKIVDLIPPGGVSDDTRLVLVNAVYFKGRWVLQFDKDASRVEPFHLEGGRTVQAPLMCQQEEVRHRKAKGYEAVELDYEGGDLSMLVLLPDRRDGLGDLEKALSPQMLNDCVMHMAHREVTVFLPRFRITCGDSLQGRLAALGMVLPFSRTQADFSGINGYKPPSDEALFISSVFHKAFAEVNEEGTEAAAATAVAAACMSRAEPSRPHIFRADHPFLFAIRDRNSGTLLFLGRVADPTRQQAG